jgi:hypothetical protein
VIKRRATEQQLLKRAARVAVATPLIADCFGQGQYYDTAKKACRGSHACMPALWVCTCPAAFCSLLQSPPHHATTTPNAHLATVCKPGYTNLPRCSRCMPGWTSSFFLGSCDACSVGYAPYNCEVCTSSSTKPSWCAKWCPPGTPWGIVDCHKCGQGDTEWVAPGCGH